MKHRQLSLISPQRKDHGGSLRQGLRKERRPFDPSRPVHVVLRSERARRQWSLHHPRHRYHADALLKRVARVCQVKVYRDTNVGNHWHLVVKAPTRAAFQRFLRVFSGRLAMLVTGARKGRPVGRFWTGLAYSRVVEWGREFKSVTRYVLLNAFEALSTRRELQEQRRVGERYRIVSLKDLTAESG